MINMINKLGQLSQVIKDTFNIELDIVECANIACAFKKRIDGALDYFNEENWEMYFDTFLMVWENEKDFENKKNEVFEYFASSLTMWRLYVKRSDEDGDTIIKMILDAFEVFYNEYDGTIIEKIRWAAIRCYNIFCVGGESQTMDDLGDKSNYGALWGINAFTVDYNGKTYGVFSLDMR